MSEELEKGVTRKFDVVSKLGKGVRTSASYRLSHLALRQACGTLFK